MHDKIHEHEPESGAISTISKLRKMADHWVGHNEEHARSYRLWAARAKDAGYDAPGEILEELAHDVIEQNEKLRRLLELVTSSDSPD